MTFDELAQQLYGLYGQGAFADAFDLATRELPHHAEMAREIHYWRACLAAKLGKTALVCAIMAEVLESGSWFSPMQLQEDADLESVRQNPEFQRLLAACRERNAAAQQEAAPLRLISEPKGGGRIPLIMALHGNSGNAQAEVEYWLPAVESGAMVAMLQSSQVEGPDGFVWNDQEMAATEAQQHYRELAATGRVDRRQVVLGGFSRGAGTAIWLAASGRVWSRGFVAVAPRWHDVAGLRQLLARKAGLRGYIVVGEEDERSIQVAKDVQAMMAEFDEQCEVELVPHLCHAYPPSFVDSLRKALRFILGAGSETGSTR